MFIRKLLNLDLESTGFGMELQPVRVQSLPSGLTGRGSSNDRGQTVPRRLRRRRVSTREPFSSGGWSIRTW